VHKVIRAIQIGVIAAGLLAFAHAVCWVALVDIAATLNAHGPATITRFQRVLGEAPTGFVPDYSLRFALYLVAIPGQDVAADYIYHVTHVLYPSLRFVAWFDPVTDVFSGWHFVQ
jgi:hypothetical protein